MTLVFCCPTCGATLRVPAATGPTAVACPQCGEGIRVPRAPHPVEAGEGVSAATQEAATRARSGARVLSVSVGLFALGATGLLTALTLRLAIAGGRADVPEWAKSVFLVGVLGWVACGVLGGVLRAVGYFRFTTALLPLGLNAWCRAATAGAVLTAVGLACVVPRAIGLTGAAVSAALLAGISCGLLGSVLEIAFLPALQRLLTNVAGWRAAARVNAYAVSLVFAFVAGTAVLGGGMVVAVLAFTGNDHHPEEVRTPPPEVRVVVTLTLSLLIALISLGCVRYLRLLTHARRALATPEPYPSAPIRHTEA